MYTFSLLSCQETFIDYYDAVTKTSWRRWEVPTAIIRETIDLAFIRLQLNRVLKAGTRARGHPLLLVADSGVG